MVNVTKENRKEIQAIIDSDYQKALKSYKSLKHGVHKVKGRKRLAKYD